MRILALVHRVPYPPNKGEKIRAYHELKFLSERGHTIDLATFADTSEDRAYGPELERYCRRACVISKDRRLSTARSTLALLRSRPLSIGYFDSIRMRRLIARWIADSTYDVAFAYSSPMAEYLMSDRIPRTLARVMDFVDVDSDKWRQYAERKREPMRTIYRMEASALEAYEREVSEAFDASVFVSEAEAAMFRTRAPKAQNVVDVPNGVDADYFGSTVRRPREGSRPLIVFVGQMDYFANVDAMTTFADEVMPRVLAALPGAELRIVGRAPTHAIQRLAKRPGITVTGAVPDVRAHLAEATLMVAPLRIARGIQNKVLEGMAARVPVIASASALEGIDARQGEEAILASNPRDQATAIIDLSRDPSRRARIEAAGRALVLEKYVWASAMARLEAVLAEAVARKRAP